jgi:flavodoxin
MDKNEMDSEEPTAARSLVVVYSYHHRNTRKVADAVAEVLGAEVRTPSQVTPGEIAEYDLVGFGSGIYSARHHDSLLDLADTLPRVTGNKAFIFSTYGAPEGLFPGARLGEFVHDNHAALRRTLESRGYRVLGEFGCAGFNTNHFLRYIGGLNRGRPDAADIGRAEAFAQEIMARAAAAGGTAVPGPVS